MIVFAGVETGAKILVGLDAHADVDAARKTTVASRIDMFFRDSTSIPVATDNYAGCLYNDGLSQRDR
jgi:hypothetical protein